ncbi:hypothetical protein D3C73_1078860 [compost metagenome]
MRVLNQALDPLKMTLVDHRHHIRVAGHRRVEVTIGTAQRIEEGFETGLWNIHKVRGDTNLPAIAGLAYGDAEGGLVQVSAGRDDHWRFAAQLQGHRHQVLRGIAHHPPANRRAAGEYQVIKRLAAERLAQLRAAIDHRHHQRVEVFGAQARYTFSGARHHFRRFEDGPVARRERRGQGAEQRVQRRVPGAQDAHRTFGLVHDPGPGAKLVIGGKHLARFVLHPPLQMVAGIFERSQGAEHVIHQGKAGGPSAKVLVDRRGQCPVVVDQQVDHLLQALAAGVDADTAGAGKGFFLARKQAGKVVRRRG